MSLVESPHKPVKELSRESEKNFLKALDSQHILFFPFSSFTFNGSRFFYDVCRHT